MKRKIAALWLLSLPLFTQAASDPAHQAFMQAKGLEPMIQTNHQHPLANHITRPIPARDNRNQDEALRTLGRDLFHERLLSRDNSIGCNACHAGVRGGTDHRPVFIGINNQIGELNSPTMFNAAFNFRQFFDGRAFDLAEQSLGPIENPVEMGHNLEEVIKILKNDEKYAQQFQQVFEDGVTEANLARALAEQGRNMIRNDSPFIRHLSGEPNQLSDQAQQGWQRFQDIGCIACHNGINLGGNAYQKLGASLAYYGVERIAKPADNGLFNRTQSENDRHVFKVPTLHSIALTHPYFHDGSIRTLEEAVEEMAEHQSGRKISVQDRDDIVAFLHSLSSDFLVERANRPRGQGRSEREAGQRGQNNANNPTR